MPAHESLTLVSALARLRRGEGRGFTFVGRDRVERYYGYDELEQEAKRRAAHLAAQGTRKGDRIALVIGEPHEFVLTFLGAAVAGAVPVPIFPRASFKKVDAYVDVLRHIISSSGAKRVFCQESNRELVEKVALEGVELANVETAFEGQAPAFEAPTITPDDLCFLQFTSGSTSKPKGVMVTHANLVANAQAFLGPAGLDRKDDDKGVSWLPLFHDMGLIGFVLGTLICDIPVVLLPTETFARSPMIWLQTIHKHRGTITFAPNFAFQLVAKRAKERDLRELDLSGVRVAGCGAEPIRAQTLVEFAEKFAPTGFPKTALLPSYGMAEATLAITFHPLGTELVIDRVDADALATGEARPATSDSAKVMELVGNGKGFPEHEVAIVDETATPLPERRVGEVVTRGPSVTAGYFENQEATAGSWKNGWLHTGDLGYFADGHLFICGRAKDLIIIRGANYYPQDIEWSVGEMEGVRRGNVFAFSVMRDGSEELVVAAECVSGDAARLQDEIATAVTSEFGLKPAEVVMVPVGTLPKTSSGKAQRSKTKSLYESGELAQHGSPGGSEG